MLLFKLNQVLETRKLIKFYLTFELFKNGEYIFFIINKYIFLLNEIIIIECTENVKWKNFKCLKPFQNSYKLINIAYYSTYNLHFCVLVRRKVQM